MNEQCKKELMIKQMRFINGVRDQCIASYGELVLDKTAPALEDSATGETMCPPYFDNLTCWPTTPAGTVATLTCSKHIHGFTNYMNNATRTCTQNGTWLNNWTNYTQCYDDGLTQMPCDLPTVNQTKLIEYYVPMIKTIAETGYSVSFCALLIAFIIMLCIKKLHCPRNKLHMHLFVSFMLRAFITLVKDFTFVQGVGIASNLMHMENYTLFVYTQDGNWACKTITSLWEYSVVANYSWILMEGLYLHNLIFRALFADSDRDILRYIVMGWVLPLFVVGAWVATKLTIANEFCWTTTDNIVPLLIIQIPIMVSVVINLVLFIKISIVLFTKLQSTINYEQAQRYQKWAKSTLVLVPLFGIHYSILVVMYFFVELNEVAEVIYLFGDQLFASSQGFFVAVLYCFLNSEVKTELKPYLHSFLTYLATNNFFKFFFPCRDRYLSSVRGRTSVCTTMSCSSLYTNGLHHHRKWDLYPRAKYSISMDKNKDHICNSSLQSWQDVSKLNNVRGGGRNGVSSNHHAKFASNGSIPVSHSYVLICEPHEMAVSCMELKHSRCQSEPHLMEEEMVMIPK